MSPYASKLLGIQRENESKGQSASSAKRSVRFVTTSPIDRKLDAHLRGRPHRDSMKRFGVNKSYDPRLQATAKALEKQMKMDAVDQNLRHRTKRSSLAKNTPILDSEYDPNVMSTRNAAMASALSKAMKRDSLHHALRHRPPKEELYKTGVLNKDHKRVSTSIAPNTRHMEHNLKRAQLWRAMRHRDSRQHLVQEGILSDNNLGRTLQAPAKKLEKSFKKDMLNRHLRHRPSWHDLEHDHIVESAYRRDTIDSSLIPKMRELETSFKQDAIDRSLRRRPTVQQLHKAHILDKGRVSFGEALTVGEKLEEHLKTRPHAKNTRMSVANSEDIFGGHDIDRSLHRVGRALDRQMRADSLSRAIRRRPTVQEMKKEGIIEENYGKVDGSLIVKKKQLEKAFLSDRLNRHVAQRPSFALKAKALDEVPDFLHEEYESPLPPRDLDKPMNLEYALDEVRHCLHNIHRFKMWLEYSD